MAVNHLFCVNPWFSRFLFHDIRSYHLYMPDSKWQQKSDPFWSKNHFSPNPTPLWDLNLKICQKAIGPVQNRLKCLVLIKFHLSSHH